MTIFILMLISFGLLAMPLDWIALSWSEVGSIKFFVNLITHQLGHAGLGHLLGNYTFMIPYAIYLEDKIGTRKFLLFYFVVGLLACFGQVLGSNGGGLIGSSGAAFGIFAGACALFRETLVRRVVAFSLLGLSVMIQFYLATHDTFSMTGYWAHFSGALGGLALMHFFPWLHSQSNSDLKKTSLSS